MSYSAINDGDIGICWICPT